MAISQNLTRRQILLGMLIGGAGLVLAACGESAAPASSAARESLDQYVRRFAGSVISLERRIGGLFSGGLSQARGGWVNGGCFDRRL